MATEVIELPGGISLSGFYYPELYRDLLAFLRANKSRLKLTDENDYEVHIQLLKSYALMAHLNNTRLDVVATEMFIDSAQILGSFRRLLRLMGVELKSATPAAAELLLKLGQSTSSTLLDVIPELADFETDSVPPINYEYLSEGLDLTRTDQWSNIFQLQETENSTTSSNKISISLGSDIVLRDGGVWATDIVGQVIFIEGASILDNTGEYRVVARLDDTNIRVLAIPEELEPNFQTESGLDWSVKKFSDDKASAINIGTPTSVLDSTPSVGDLFYICHTEVLMDRLNFTFSATGTRLFGVWEYYDEERSLLNPKTVYNNGSTLSFDLETLLTSENRSGAYITVTYVPTGEKEIVKSSYGNKTGLGDPVGATDVNYVETSTLLGQSGGVSTDLGDYTITSDWVPFEDVTDNTEGVSSNLAANGTISWDLPQTFDRSWSKTKVNLVEGRWLRFRVVVDNGASTVSTISGLTLDEGSQYLTVVVNQGETIEEQILGSSTGQPNQEFVLLDSPYIDNTEVIEIDETGSSNFVEWERVDTFLNSSATDRHYIRETNDNDEGVIIFGDGVNGRIPPTFVNNIRAQTYRVGGDFNGNVGADTITVNADGLSNIATVTNPRAATGWRIKEGGDDADKERLRRAGPASLRVRGVASHVGDIDYLAVNEFTDSVGIKPVTRAFAEEGGFGVKSSKLLVVGIGGATLSSRELTELETYFNGDRKARPPVSGVLTMNQRVVAVNYEPAVINLTAEVIWPGGNAETIKNELINFLNPLTIELTSFTYVWDFGSQISLSKIYNLIHSINTNIIDIPSLTMSKGDDPEATASINLASNELPVARASTINIIVREA